MTMTRPASRKNSTDAANRLVRTRSVRDGVGTAAADSFCVELISTPSRGWRSDRKGAGGDQEADGEDGQAVVLQQRDEGLDRVDPGDARGDVDGGTRRRGRPLGRGEDQHGGGG